MRDVLLKKVPHPVVGIGFAHSHGYHFLNFLLGHTTLEATRSIFQKLLAHQPLLEVLSLFLYSPVPPMPKSLVPKVWSAEKYLT
jgi:hypothetical protein